MSSKPPAPDDDETNTTASDDRSRGSNHNIGAAMTGAMQKLSSPIGDRFRKVARKSNSGTPLNDVNATPSKQDKNPSDHSSGSKNSTHSPSSAGKKKPFEGVEKASETLLVNPAKEVAQFFGGAGKGVKQLVVRNRGSLSNHPEEEQQDDSDLPPVPPDDTLQKMNIIINKRLKGVSIPSYYTTAWSENTGDGNEPLYRSFLEDSGKEDINVGDWQVAETGNEFVGDWDGEKYTQKRTVTFVFDKKIPLQSKPVVAKVKQTHYCRVEGNDKCVVAMTIDMQGVPFSECFNVEIRWVATRSGKNDVAIQVGLFVNFVKSTVLAGKIRSGTTDQTTQQQLQLFDKVQGACGATVEEVPEEETPPTPTSKLSQDAAGRILVLSGCLLLFASQAYYLFNRNSRVPAQTQMSSSGVTFIVAGLMLLVPNVCQLPEEQYLFVVVAHWAQLLPKFPLVLSSLKHGVTTLTLMGAWAILAWGVWQQTPSKTTAEEGVSVNSKVKTS